MSMLVFTEIMANDESYTSVVNEAAAGRPATQSIRPIENTARNATPIEEREAETRDFRCQVWRS